MENKKKMLTIFYIEIENEKTLADFKRSIQIGEAILLVELFEKNNSGELVKKEIPEKMAPIRFVSYKDSTGFYLKSPEDTSKRGSFCGYPKSPCLKYYDDTFIIIEKDSDGNIWQLRKYQIIKN